MSVRDFYVILNPAAGRGRAARAWPLAERALRASGARFQVARTERREHAAELAERAAREGWPAVAAVGGDGVIHEVVNGLVRAAGDDPTVPLGIVAAGSGNDFVKMLGLPAHRPVDAVRRLVSAAARPVDVGWVSRCVAERGRGGGWCFVNGIGVGFDAQVAAEAARIRRLRGMAIYAVALARTLRRLRAPRMRVVVDGREVADRPLVLATIGNGACHGGSFRLCPGARVDDGELDVLLGDARGVREVLALVPRVVRGRHLGERGVAVHRGRRVEITGAEPLPVHADGEVVAAGAREIAAEVLPGRLRVLA